MHTQLAGINKNMNFVTGTSDKNSAKAVKLSHRNISNNKQIKQTRKPLRGKRRLTDQNGRAFQPQRSSTPTKMNDLPEIINLSPIKMDQISQYLKECELDSDTDIDTSQSDTESNNRKQKMARFNLDIIFQDSASKSSSNYQ